MNLIGTPVDTEGIMVFKFVGKRSNVHYPMYSLICIIKIRPLSEQPVKLTGCLD